VGRATTEEASGLAMLSRLGNESIIHKRTPPPITLPKLNLPALDVEAIEAETRQAQARVRVIRAGRDAWEAVTKAQSFDGWLAIGKALAVGRDFALRVTGADRPEGRRYCAEFSQWIMDRAARLCRNAEERALRRHRVCREYRGHRGVEIDAG
jgi:hypothetical protein